MATRSALEKRLCNLETKSKPKMISTLADYVLFIANRQDGEEWPPLSPEMQGVFDNLAKKGERHKEGS